MNCETTGFLLEDLFFLIGLKTKTGELVLESGNNIGSIFFHDGKILQAFSPYSRAIGDLLVEGGIITETELLDTLKQQKKEGVSPIGCLFLKSGKVSFGVIEMMVHAQIRQSVKEFTTWNTLRASFVDKDIQPFDCIHLPVHEFLTGDLLQSAKTFFSPVKPVPEEQTASASTKVS